LEDGISNPAGSPVTFTIISGSSWLSIDAKGRLGGVPAEGDVGMNTWQVEVSDDKGHIETATLKIKVWPKVFPVEVSKTFSVIDPSSSAGGGARFGYHREKNTSIRYIYEMSQDMKTWTSLVDGLDYAETHKDGPLKGERVEMEMIGRNVGLRRMFLRLRLDIVDSN
jgi:hypothetical protein